MVFSQVKINPGRPFVQLPHPGGNKISTQGMGHATVLEPFIGPDPDATSVWIHFTKTIPATAAGTITGMLGAAGLRT